MGSERINGKEVRLAQAGRTTRNGRAMLQPVRFEYTNGAAREVTITGSFNKWDVLNMPLVRLADGRWLRVMFLPPSCYEYLFVVDGRCVADPRASESVPNVFGCVNSVVSVPAAIVSNRCIGRINGHKPVSPLRAPAQSRPRSCCATHAPHDLSPATRAR